MTNSSLYDRLQRNIEFLTETQARIRDGDLRGLQPFDDVIALCAAIEDQPIEITWMVRDDIAKLVEQLDMLIASIKAYEAALEGIEE